MVGYLKWRQDNHVAALQHRTGPQHYSHRSRTASVQSSSLISAILVNFRARLRLEVSGSTEDNFISTENDAAITDGGEDIE